MGHKSLYFGIRGKRMRLLAAGASIAALASMPVHAQEAAEDNEAAEAVSESGPRVIIVTAQRRVQRDLDVPIAITALGADDVQNITAGFLTDVAFRVPNVQMTPGTNSPSISIRGVSSQSNINAGFPPAVGVYVDEVYQGRDPTFNTILNDIERIEVLRGPQGTLYGKNTIGGAINIITRDPTNDLSFSGDLTYGNFDLLQLRGSVGGAIVPDQLMVRVSAVHRQRDGFIENSFTGQDLNGLNSDGGRIVILSNLSENVRLRLSADYFTEEGTTALETGPATLAPLALFAGIPPQDPTDNIVQLNASEFAERELYGFSGRFDFDLGPVTLTSITAFRIYTSDFNDDSDGLPVDAFEVGREENSDNFSQELRLASNTEGPLNWLLGFYYYEEDTENIRRIRLGEDMPFLLAANLAPFVFPGYMGESALTTSRIEASSYAFFGSLTYDITERFHLSGGLRFTHESKDFTYEQAYTQLYTAGPAGGIIPNFAVAIPRRTEDYSDGRLTGDASLSFDITSDHVIYASYSRGFKAGGFQTDVISPPFDPSEDFGFNPETVDNYEIGFKALLFDRRVRLNVSAFHMDWSNKQEQIFTGLSFLIRNAATAKSTGFEVELTAQLADGLTFDGNLGYLDTRYSSFPGNALDGQNFSDLPEWTGAAGLQYVVPVSNDLELFMRGDLIHRGSTYTLPSATVRFDNAAVTTYNARFGVQSADGHWGFYLWGRNLSDETRLGRGSYFPFPGATITTRGPGLGRTYGLELRTSF